MDNQHRILAKNGFYVDIVTNFGNCRLGKDLYKSLRLGMKVPRTLPSLNQSPYGKQRIVVIKKPTSTYSALQKKPGVLQIHHIIILNKYPDLQIYRE